MIIVLKDADFSENNVGKLYDPVTVAIFTRCTRFAIGSPQSEVVDIFVRSIKSNGIYEHLSCMFFPWLSKANDEAFYNFADNTILNYNIYGGSFETRPDGRCNPVGDDGYLAALSTTIPTINFFGLIRQSYPATAWVGNPYFRGSGIQVGMASETGTIIANNNNFNAGNGYKSQDSDIETMLVEIGALSDLEQSATTKINGLPVVISGSYSKSTEPLPNEIKWYAPNYLRYAAGQARVIAFAGDGTVLSGEQSTAFLAAMKALRTGLAALESD